MFHFPQFTLVIFEFFHTREHYRDRGQRWENQHRAKNESDYRICCRALLENNNSNYRQRISYSLELLLLS